MRFALLLFVFATSCAPSLPFGPQPRPVGAEGEGEGGVFVGGQEGEGQPADPNTTVPASGPITMLVDDPRDATVALVGTQVGTFNDQIAPFDVDVDTLGRVPSVDFEPTGDACGPRAVTFVTAADVGEDVLPAGDEAWVTCADHVAIVRANDPLHPSSPVTFTSAMVARLLSPYTRDTSAAGRVLLADIGGDTLTIVDVRAGDIANGLRATESFSDDTTFTAIAQIWKLVVDDAVLGDVALVFDRGAHALVPIQREPGSSTWHGAPITGASTSLAPFSVDPGIDAVWIDESSAFDLVTLAPSDASANLVLITNDTGARDQFNLPFGMASFFRYESALTGGPALAGQTLDATATHGSLKDPVLLAAKKSGSSFMLAYAASTADVVWRIPLPGAAVSYRYSNGPFAPDCTNAECVPNGIALADDGAAWVSFRGLRELLLRFR